MNSGIPPRPEPYLTDINHSKISMKERWYVLIGWVVLLLSIGILIYFVALGRIAADEKQARAKAQCLELGYQEYWLDGNVLYCSHKIDTVIIDFE